MNNSFPLHFIVNRKGAKIYAKGAKTTGIKFPWRPLRSSLGVFAVMSLLFLIGFTACQQTPSTSTNWPEITQEAKPWTRWWWQGSGVTKEGITAELEAYKEAGIGGLELTPIYGVIGEENGFIEYLSPEWMDMLEFTLQEAKRLGLGVDMATGTGWPFGGPWVDADDACKYLAHKTYSLSGGQKLNEAISYTENGFVRAVTNQVYQLYGMYKAKGETVKGSQEFPELLENVKRLTLEDLVQPVSQNENLQAKALDQVRFNNELPLVSLVAYSESGDVVDVTDKVGESGMLDWTAPDGNWTLYAVFEGLHGKMVERAAPGGEGNVIDHFSTEAIQHYLNRFDEAFQGRDLSGLRSFFNDSYEVDDARGQANWTPKMLETFQKKRGYDLREYWPALLGEGDKEINHRVLSDYRETISDLLLETFTSEWSEWAKSKGKIIRNQAHGSPSNILDLYAASDIPETEGTDLIRIKFATSAAHVGGRKLASAEAATWLDEHFRSNLATLKQNLDRYLVGGVNHLLYHGTCYSPPGDEWPGRLFYAAIHANPRNTLWNDFADLNQYVARSQSFLQAGSPDNDVLLYFPAYDRFATPQRELLDHFDGHGPSLEGTHFEELALLLLEKGFAYDYISDRQIEGLTVADGLLQTGGITYKTILVPQTTFMPEATLAKLADLAKQGAKVVFHESLPESVPGMGKLEERQGAFQTLIDQIISQQGDQGGNILKGSNAVNLLESAGVRREALVDHGLHYARRTYQDGKSYFLANWAEEGPKEDNDGWIPVQMGAKSVIFFDPMTGRKGKARIRNAKDGACEVYLQLPYGRSLVMIVSANEQEAQDWQYYEKEGDAVTLEGDWEIEFTRGGPTLPDAVTTNVLSSWVSWENEAYRNFSGTARYSIDFSKPSGAGSGWLLDLGEVHESARVSLNGKKIGTLIGPVFRIFLPADQMQQSNTLEIEVSNLMANRIADMDRRNVFWKKFYNVNFPPRRRENLGKNGLFDATKWEPLPSGLVGPVSLSAVK